MKILTIIILLASFGWSNSPDPKIYENHLERLDDYLKNKQLALFTSLQDSIIKDIEKDRLIKIILKNQELNRSKLSDKKL